MPADEAATASVNAIPTVVEMMQACIGEIEPGHRPAEQTSQPLLQSPEAQQGAMHHLVGCDQQQAIGHTGDEDGPDRGPPQGQTSVQPGAAKQQGTQRRQAEGGPGSLAGSERSSEAPHLSAEITNQGCSGQRRHRFRGEKHSLIKISPHGRT